MKAWHNKEEWAREWADWHVNELISSGYGRFNRTLSIIDRLISYSEVTKHTVIRDYTFAPWIFPSVVDRLATSILEIVQAHYSEVKTKVRGVRQSGLRDYSADSEVEYLSSAAWELGSELMALFTSPTLGEEIYKVLLDSYQREEPGVRYFRDFL